MPNFKSSNPLFVDLFYGVVVGSSISMLTVDSLETLPFKIIWLLAVLEDWFLYYSYVVDNPSTAVSWTFKSLLIEFAILLTWFLGFDALRQVPTHKLFFLFAALFYLVKILGGVTFYWKHGQLLTRRMAFDLVWFIPIVFSLCVYWNFSEGMFRWNFYLVSLATGVSLALWWILWHFFPFKHDPAQNSNA